MNTCNDEIGSQAKEGNLAVDIEHAKAGEYKNAADDIKRPSGKTTTTANEKSPFTLDK